MKKSLTNFTTILVCYGSLYKTYTHIYKTSLDIFVESVLKKRQLSNVTKAIFENIFERKEKKSKRKSIKKF